MGLLVASGYNAGCFSIIDQISTFICCNLSIRLIFNEIKTPNGSLGPGDLAPTYYTAGSSESATRTMDEMHAKNARIAKKLGISVQSLGDLQYNQMMIQYNFLTAYRDFHPLPDDQGYFVDTNGHISVAYMAPGCAWNPRLRSMECNFGGSPPAQLPAK